MEIACCRADPLPMQHALVISASPHIPGPPPNPHSAAMSPGASRTLSNLEQMESPGSIPAVPAAGGAAAGAEPAAGLSAQRAEAVEALKSAAVQRRLPVVPVPLGPAGGCWRGDYCGIGGLGAHHTAHLGCQLGAQGTYSTLQPRHAFDAHSAPHAQPTTVQAPRCSSPSPPGCCANR